MKELKKSTRREPVSRKKNTAEKKEQTAKKSTKKNTGKEIKKENKKDTEKGTWKSVTKERVYDPNGKVLVITYACVVLFLALAVYMGYFLQRLRQRAKLGVDILFHKGKPGAFPSIGKARLPALGRAPQRIDMHADLPLPVGRHQ